MAYTQATVSLGMTLYTAMHIVQYGPYGWYYGPTTDH